MTNNSYLSKSKKRIPFIDLWSMFYLLVVYLFSFLFDQANIFVFAVYVIYAVPFIFHIDKYVCICFLLSTMSYFFLGGDEGVWSLYTVLAIMMILKLFSKAKTVLPLKAFLYFLWMIIAVGLSYYYSEFKYLNGMFAMVYNIVIAILISTTIKINRNTIVSFLPKIAVFQLVTYMGLLLINGRFDGYGLTISENVNRNTFGASVAILSIILFVKIVFFKSKSYIYKAFWVISLMLVVVIGSRNSLLATIVTSIVIYMVSKKHQGKTISGGVKFLIAASFIVFFGGGLLTAIGVDLTRYDYIELINTGGSNRSIIWETLSPVIWRKHKWFGYGPSHYCSELMISSLLKRDYTHTHNTIFEAWGELGIFGVVPFILILLQTYKKGRFYIKNEGSYLMFVFIFIGVLLLGMGESFFANIELWIIIGLLFGNKSVQDELL